MVLRWVSAPKLCTQVFADVNNKASFAAKWQSTYGGTVPAKSLFAYFQHLGMTMVV